MNERRSFDRRFTEAMDTERAGARLPSSFFDDFRQRAGHSRPRPRWLALIKEPPMRTDSQLAVGSPTVRVAAVLAATFLLAVALAGIGIAGQRLLAADGVIVVAQDGSGTVSTITEAVAMAEDGDTILVRPGTYDESVDVTGDITIRGDGERDAVALALSAQLDGMAQVNDEGLPYALGLTGSNATIENLTLRGESSRVVIDGGSPTLRGLVFDDIGRVFGLDATTGSVPGGVHLQGGTTATIEDNEFVSSTLLIFDGSSPRVVDNAFEPGGIFMDGIGTAPLVQGNSITSAGFHAVTAWGGARPEIRANTVSSTSMSAGIHVGYEGFPSADVDPWPTITGNTIEHSGTGIEIADGAGGDVSDNRLIDNVYGIYVHNFGTPTASEASIAGNEVRGGLLGIVTAGPVAPEIVDNDIADVKNAGINATQGSAPTLRGNTICDAASQGILVQTDADPRIDASNEVCAGEAG